MNVRLVFLSVAALVTVASIPSLATGLKPSGKLVPKASTLSQNLLERIPSPTLSDSSSDSESVRKVGKPYSKERYQTENSIAKVQTHALEGKPAATLYVQDIPVFTFVDPASAVADELADEPADEPSKKSLTKVAATEQLQNAAEVGAEVGTDPLTMAYPSALARATAIAAELNRFQQDNGDSQPDFQPGWDEEQGVYLVKLGDRRLITLDDSTQYSNSAGATAEDLRQSINRLRQLMAPNAATKIEEISEAEIARLRPEAEPAASESLSEGYVYGHEVLASWYGPGFHGRLTANGEIYDQNAMTAAHKSLPFGTMVRVTNLDNGLSTVVRINDRGPYIHGREIDLSAAAAATLGAVQSGIALVRMEILN